MAVSINHLLGNFASSLYINPDGVEGAKIQRSVNNLISNLNYYYKSSIKGVNKFGSYTRGTILPRTYDAYSDVDLMIMLNRNSLDITPRTMRDSLMKFSDTYYKQSIKYRDSPVVVLELEHIQYDLVPAIEVPSVWGITQIYIPKNDRDWQVTDPNSFNKTLTDANVRYNSFVKPIARLMKAWNAKVDYPLASYDLEREIAGMNFSGDNYETGFLYAIKILNINGYSQNVQNKIQALKNNGERVQNALVTDRLITAKDWLSHILPIPKN